MADKILAFRIEIEGVSEESKQLTKIDQQLKNLNKTRKATEKAVKENNISRTKGNKILSELNSKTKDLQVQKAKLNKTERLSAQSFQATKGSMSALRAETSKMVDELNQMNLETKQGKEAFAKMAPQIEKNRKKIRDFDRQMSGSKTLVGEYGKGITGAFKQIAVGVVAAMAALRSVQRVVTKSLDLYDQQAKAERSLLIALKGREDAQGRLIQQAKALQLTTLYGDEETIKAQALIAAFVKEEEQIKRVIPLVQDLATAKGMDLAGAADLVSKTLGSSTNALSRYGIEVTGAVGSVERLESLMLGLNNAFGGQAEAAAEVGTGAITQFKNVIGDLQEDMGAAIITLTDLNDKLAGLSNTLSTLDIKGLSEKWKTFKTENEGAVFALKAWFTPMQEYNRLVGKGAVKLIDWIGGSEDATEAVEDQTFSIKSLGDAFKYTGQQLISLLKDEEDGTEIVKAFTDVSEILKTLASESLDEGPIDEYANRIEYYQNKLGSTADEAFNAWKDRNSAKYNAELELQLAENKARDESVKAEIEAENEKKAAKASTIATAIDLTNKFSDLFSAAKEKELNAAGDNAEKREEIERKYAKREARISYLQAIINTKVGVTKALELPPPWNFIQAGLIGVAGLAQALIIKNSIEEFAGGGLIRSGNELPGYSKDEDNTLAMLKPGEVVLNKTQQTAIGGSSTLRAAGVPGFASGGIIPPSPNTSIMDARADRSAQLQAIRVVLNVNDLHSAENELSVINENNLL